MLAALFAPITLTAGPVAAYNVAMILGPVVSGLALALALGAWVERWWPRAAAGLLYGFSPFVDRAQLGRAPQPRVGRAAAGPAVAAARTARRTPPPAVADRRARRGGVRLQTGIYTQTVALCAVLLVVLALMLAVRWPRRGGAQGAGRAAGRGGVPGTYAVLCAYPLYLLLAGPGRPRSEIREPETTNSDAANLLVPTPLTPVPHGHGPARREAAHPLR